MELIKGLIFVILIIIFYYFCFKFKIHPFIFLLLASLLIGIISGLEIKRVVSIVVDGFGLTLKRIGIVIALGAIIGFYLEKSNGALVLARGIMKVTGLKNIDLAFNIAGYIVSIPVFCDSGFIILSPLIRQFKIDRKFSVSLSIALATGLYATHVFVPPTPGPLASSAILGVDIGLMIIYGLIVAFPVAISGFLYGRYISKKIEIEFSTNEGKLSDDLDIYPSFISSFLPLVLPVLLISLGSIASLPGKLFGGGIFYELIIFVGDPVIALVIGFIFAYRLKKFIRDNLENLTSEALKSAGLIILITGSGGALGRILNEVKFGDIVGDTGIHNFGLLLPFFIAMILKSLQGSSTVSIITTSSIISPILSTIGFTTSAEKVLVALAISSGSMIVSHVNDSYFWVISQFSSFKVNDTLKGFTPATFIQGITGIVTVYFIYFLSKF